MCISVCRICFLLCYAYVLLLLNHQNTLSQKLRPSKWRDSVIQMEPPESVYRSAEDSKKKRTPREARTTWTGKLGSRQNMETSCRDQCGQLFDLPCSCDIQCLVYKNCCEDLNLECPEMLEEAESLYTPKLLNIQIECIHDGMLAISGCPNVNSVSTANLSNTWINEHREKMNRLQAAVFGKESLTEIEEDSQAGAQSGKQRQSIFQLLNNIPVSDISTGLLYKTPEIFSCNIGPESVPAPWSVEIESRQVLTDIQQMQHITAENYQYKHIPPAQLPADRVYRLCVPNAIGTCKHPQDKCKPFLSYVRLNADASVVYNNKYCALCNGHKEEDTYNLTNPEGQRTNFALSVLMSITNDKLELSLAGDEHRVQIIPWKQAECDLSQEIHVKEKKKMSACHIDSCNNRFVLDPDGTCKRLEIFSLALSDHGHTPFPASSFTSRDLQMGQEEGSQKTVNGPLRALPALIRCVLETNFGYDLDETEYPLRIRRDARLNATMFVVDVQVYLTSDDVLIEEINIGLSAMSMIAKALFLYNKTWYVTPRTKSIKTIDSKNTGVLEEIKTTNGRLQFSDSNRFPLQAQNCIESLDNFTVCVCYLWFLQRTPSHLSDQRCPLVCYEDGFCDSEVEEVQAFSKAKCFSRFQRLASCGISWAKRNSLLMWPLIVCRSIVIK